MAEKHRIPNSILEACGLQASQIRDVYPCTTFQSDLIYATIRKQRDYTSRFIFRLSSTPYEPAQVKDAVEIVFSETPILRTRFVEHKKNLVQVVVRDKIDWLNHDSVEEYLKADRQRDFTLGQPASRFAWIQDSVGGSSMVWTLHRAQYDDRSLDIILERLFYYAPAHVRFAETRKSISFRKYVKAIGAIDKVAAHTFWVRHLSQLDLCGRVCRQVKTSDPVASQRVAEIFHFVFPANCLYPPALLARAAWSVIIAKLSRSQHVLFGNVNNGLNVDLPNVKNVCGPTTTIVPWRTRLSPDLIIADWLEDQYRERLDCVPFEESGLSQYRKISKLAFFDTLLAVQESRPGDAVKSQKLFKPDETQDTTVEYPCSMFLNVQFKFQKCSIEIKYDELRVDTQLITKIVEYFVRIIKGLAILQKITIGEMIANLDLPDLSGGQEQDSDQLTRQDTSEPANSEPEESDAESSQFDAEFALQSPVFDFDDTGIISWKRTSDEID